MSSKDVKKNTSTDLDVVAQSAPSEKLDDKAAELEVQLAEIKVRLETERTLFFFAISSLLVVGVGLASESNFLFAATVVLALVFNTVFSQTLGTPLLANYLEPWNERMKQAFDLHVLKKGNTDEVSEFED